MDELAAHLRASLGAWPPRDGALLVTTSEARSTPGWDGIARAFQGLRTPDGTIISVHPERLHEVVDARTEADVERALGVRLFDVMYRFALDTPALEPLGEWIPCDDPVVPEWLHPFGGDVLVHLEDGRYIAGVGLKKHDEHAWEISVGTEEAARGKGFARRLVVTAARRVLDEGRVPTYLHDLRNTASAHVAEASGFPDRGWRLLVAM